MFKNNKLFFWTVEILAIASLIFILTKLDFLFKPIGSLFATVFIPFLIAGFLYYAFNPLIELLQKKFKIKRSLGILIVFIILIGLVVFMVVSFVPTIINQLTGLVNATANAIPDIQKWVEELAQRKEFRDLNIEEAFQKLNLSYSSILKNVLNGVTLSLNGMLSTITRVGLILVLAPILLYYMLRDGHKLLPTLKKTILKDDKYNITGLLETLNDTMSRYILGSAIDCSIIFIFVFIGYLVMGIPYAFLLATFSAITNLIPYLGPYIGMAPMVLVVAADDWKKAVVAVIYVAVVQQIDGNFIYPKVVGNAMKIHPVTIMLLMLVVGNLYGLVGMIIAVPAYSLIKEVVKFIANIFEEKKKAKA
ncbi:AI-2E family transporter [Floricoccus penangensis]|uniref:AI-2E family transporter n=1 Tax=Floricoccus penangensis TaxID=1859475 RepID=A0A9Q5JGB0_9LACT|nr:AI-2E family transporter [Floricoccus penangensis]OFI46476.1 AI-2E family transporter [Floricoccus penangensis]